jgi:SHS2 domain-containing protein
MDMTSPSGSGAEMAAAHEFEDHASELQMRLEAPTFAELLAEAGRALAEVLGGPAFSNHLGPYLSVHLRAPDRSALLVEWLNELIFRAETERQIFTDFRIERVSDQELSASIRGPEVELNQTPVKAATMHKVAILEEPGGLRATVVLDV